MAIRLKRGSRTGAAVFGGAAMEYIIVSTAAALVAIAATAFTVKSFQEQTAKMQSLMSGEAEVAQFLGEYAR